MSIPAVTISDLMNASVHVGHKTMFWHPKMESYIYGKMNTMHIIDLEKTLPLLRYALNAVYNVVARGGHVLFVATKPQATEVVKEEATRCGQFYINKRWLGGLLTNWNTVYASIKKMESYRKTLEDPDINMIKKERMQLERKYKKCLGYFGGIVGLKSTPDIVFIIDTARERIAVKEISKVGIPIVGITDTNADPTLIDYPIPGNDDSVRAIKLYARLVADVAISGLKTYVERTSSAKEDAKDPASNKVTESSSASGDSADSGTANIDDVTKRDDVAKRDDAIKIDDGDNASSS